MRRRPVADSALSRGRSKFRVVGLRRRACQLGEIVNRGPAAIQFRWLHAATLYVRARTHIHVSVLPAARQFASLEEQFARFLTRFRVRSIIESAFALSRGMHPRDCLDCAGYVILRRVPCRRTITNGGYFVTPWEFMKFIVDDYNNTTLINHC